MAAVLHKTHPPNGTPVLVSAGNEAHRSVADHAYCGLNRRALEPMSYIQARVYRSPMWCPKCWPGGVS